MATATEKQLETVDLLKNIFQMEDETMTGVSVLMKSTANTVKILQAMLKEGGQLFVTSSGTISLN